MKTIREELNRNDIDEFVLETEESFKVFEHLRVTDFKNCGTIFSTFLATCPRCGSNEDVFADIKVTKGVANKNERIVTTRIICRHCNRQLEWGFRVEK